MYCPCFTRNRISAQRIFVIDGKTKDSLFLWNEGWQNLSLAWWTRLKKRTLHIRRVYWNTIQIIPFDVVNHIIAEQFKYKTNFKWITFLSNYLIKSQKYNSKPIALTHFFIFMCIHWSISHGSSESSRSSWRPHLTLSISILSCQPEIQHVNVPHGGGSSTNSKIGRLDIPVKKPNFVNCFNAFEYLVA